MLWKIKKRHLCMVPGNNNRNNNNNYITLYDFSLLQNSLLYNGILLGEILINIKSLFSFSHFFLLEFSFNLNFKNLLHYNKYVNNIV